MNTLIDTLKNARYSTGYIILLLQSGVEIKFPVEKNHRLNSGTQEQLCNIEISPMGLHWPDLDEDLSLKGILNGDYGQYV